MENAVVTLKLQDGSNVQVLSGILVKHSPVFRAMLEAPMREGLDKEIDMSEYKPQDVKMLVSALAKEYYEQKLDCDASMLCLTEMARFYQIECILQRIVARAASGGNLGLLAHILEVYHPTSIDWKWTHPAGIEGIPEFVAAAPDHLVVELIENIIKKR